jgi:hypothetical protein
MRICTNLERISPIIYQGEKCFEQSLQRQVKSTFYTQLTFSIRFTVFEKIEQQSEPARIVRHMLYTTVYVLA